VEDGAWRRTAHRQAILERCCLGLDRGSMVWRREASSEGHGKTSGTATQTLREVQSESPGRHGARCGGRGDGGGGGGGMSGLRERSTTVWERGPSINRKTDLEGSRADFASLPRGAYGGK